MKLIAKGLNQAELKRQVSILLHAQHDQGSIFSGGGGGVFFGGYHTKNLCVLELECMSIKHCFLGQGEASHPPPRLDRTLTMRGVRGLIQELTTS